MLTEQVIGYYDPAAKVLYVVKGADDQTVGITITHELVHALQDQYTNLDSIQKSTTDSDRLTAAQAVIEGQAQFEQLSIMVGGSEQHRAARWRPGPDSRDDPREPERHAGVRDGADGHPGVAALSLPEPVPTSCSGSRSRRGRRACSAGSRAPRSRSSRRAAYFSAAPDEPTVVTLPAPRGATKVYDNNMGEFGTRLLIYQHLRDEQPAARAAAGWDGDRFMVVKRGTAKGIVWASVWDSTIEAAEFSDVLIRATPEAHGRRGALRGSRRRDVPADRAASSRSFLASSMAARS